MSHQQVLIGKLMAVGKRAEAARKALELLDDAKDELAEYMCEVNTKGITFSQIADWMKGCKTVGTIMHENRLPGGNQASPYWSNTALVAFVNRYEHRQGTERGTGNQRRYKVTEDRNREIRRLRDEEGWSWADLSAKFGLRIGYLQDIVGKVRLAIDQ